MFRIVTPVCTKRFECIQQVLYVFSWCNGELERNSTLQLQVQSVVRFLTTENNSDAKIHRLLGTD